MNVSPGTLRFLMLFFSLVTISCILSCQTGQPPEPVDGLPSPKSSAPGFGTSRERPTGQPFIWPAGISVVGKPTLAYDCESESVLKNKKYGSGGVVRFCLTLNNTNAGAVVIKLPPGIIWIAEASTGADAVQNGIMLKPVQFTVAANSQFTVLLFAYCINRDRDPTGYLDAYEPQPVVTTHAGMLELAQLVSSKQINEEELTKPLPTEDWIILQNAVHEVDETGRVSDDSRRKLKALP